MKYIHQVTLFVLMHLQDDIELSFPALRTSARIDREVGRMALLFAEQGNLILCNDLFFEKVSLQDFEFLNRRHILLICKGKLAVLVL